MQGAVRRRYREGDTDPDTQCCYRSTSLIGKCLSWEGIIALPRVICGNVACFELSLSAWPSPRSVYNRTPSIIHIREEAQYTGAAIIDVWRAGIIVRIRAWPGAGLGRAEMPCGLPEHPRVICGNVACFTVWVYRATSITRTPPPPGTVIGP